MIADSQSRFTQYVLRRLASERESPEPTACYDPDGDCIHFLLRPDCCYAERVDDFITLYYEQETGQLVGAEIKAFSNFCRDIERRFPALRLVIREGRIKMRHLLLAKLMMLNDRAKMTRVVAYKKLFEAAEETEVEAEPCPK